MPDFRFEADSLARTRLRIRRTRLAASLAFAGVAMALGGCHGPLTIGDGKPTLELTSDSIRSGEIQKQNTCDDAGASPELSWSAPPAGTKSFALIAFDHDSLVGSFAHWVLYDLPPERRKLMEGIPAQAELPDGSRQGQNDNDKVGYAGPCPPFKMRHHYVFALYALDSKLNLPAGATRGDVEKALKPHILAHGELIGTYKR
jgi:Raf kinase inhibitor-like YbhB/YbcL family protein